MPGLNYKDHAAELGLALPDFPIIFLRGETSLTAHNGPLIVPKVSHQLEFEAELGVVIGRQAHHVKSGDALNYVFGVTCVNDGSIRDYQRKTPQITTGKNFDSTGAFGPELVTLDELPSGPDELKIECRVNGATLQSSNTNQHIFRVREAIQFLSSMMTLEPGDAIAFGTLAASAWLEHHRCGCVTVISAKLKSKALALCETSSRPRPEPSVHPLYTTHAAALAISCALTPV